MDTFVTVVGNLTDGAYHAPPGLRRSLDMPLRAVVTG